LVTCQKQPALGCVFKLVEIAGQPRIKLSQDLEKTLIPGRKQVYRLSGSGVSPSAFPLVDLIQLASAPPPVVGRRVMCRHPFQEKKRAQITPSQVMPLLLLVWDADKGRVSDEDEGNGEKEGEKEGDESSGSSSGSGSDKVQRIKTYITEQMEQIRPDHLRYLNPTPYKVSVDQPLYDFMHELWMTEAPVHDLE
jgi:nicotinate phosphoribosyltransferase